MGFGPIDPNNPLFPFFKDPKNVQFVKDAEEWAVRFWKAIQDKDYPRARNFLNTIKNLVKKPAPELIEEMERILAALRNELGIVEEAGKVLTAVGETAEGLSLGWMAVIALVFVLLIAACAHGEELPEQERKKFKERIKDHFSKLPADPTLNPVADLNHKAQEIKRRIRAKCPCWQQSHQLSALGGNLEGQQLAMATTPFPPSGAVQPGGTTPYPSGPGSSGGSSTGGGKHPHGRPDPFQFPSRGGVPMHPPGKGKPDSNTLPFTPPPAICKWPDCPSGKQKTCA
jgi:hypothetical protein